MINHKPMVAFTDHVIFYPATQKCMWP